LKGKRHTNSDGKTYRYGSSQTARNWKHFIQHREGIESDVVAYLDDKHGVTADFHQDDSDEVFGYMAESLMAQQKEEEIEIDWEGQLRELFQVKKPLPGKKNSTLPDKVKIICDHCGHEFECFNDAISVTCHNKECRKEFVGPWSKAHPDNPLSMLYDGKKAA
jgi:hypothetical protein